ncbi:MAG: AAA family ATPase [Opitutae bacterium]|nr:AAA family ATPase [Opitutae bacterium]
MNSNHTTAIKGVLERIVFFNDENSYCIAELSLNNSNKKVTILGALPNIQCGETLSVKGEWIEHEKHGSQFKVSAFSTELPASIYGIKKYLGSGLIRGIGKSYADKIVDYFGTETIKIISSESGRLQEIPGIGQSRVKSIKVAWEEQVAVRDVMLFLQTYGVTPSQCLKLVKKYGNNTKRIIQDQPYKIAEEIDRIGFKTADQLALNLGFPTNSKERIDAGIIYTVSKIQENGHTIALIPMLSEQAAHLLGLEQRLIGNRIEALIQDKKLYAIQAYNSEDLFLGPAVQSPIFAFYESKIAEAIHLIYNSKSNLPDIKLDSAIEWAQQKAGFQFESKQTLAVQTALSNKITIITGGPGTGKTTILRAVVEILSAKKCKIALTSPTGRAAQRLSESTKKEAKTIHRLLKFDPSTGSFFHNKENLLQCDCIIIDETSMVDTQLAASLFDAIPSTAHLILVGDSDQLPSVGPGNMLSDLKNSSFSNVVRLETIYRQAKESRIITTAHNILKGVNEPEMTLQSLHHLDPNIDFNFIEVEDDDRMLKAILYLVKDYLPKIGKLGGVDPIQDIQILSPMHKGSSGIQNLNDALQNCLNDPTKAKGRITAQKNYQSAKQTFFKEKTKKPFPFEIAYGNLHYRIGDKVIQTINNYDKNVFNGDIGIIKSIGIDESTISIAYNQNLVEYKRNELSQIQLAYALSIHKSQGSEYPIVILPLTKQHFIMLQRNLLYTAITRAKEKLFIIGSVEAYSIAVKNNKTDVRRTNLFKKLKKLTENN